MSTGTVESRNHAAFDETMARHFYQSQSLSIAITRSDFRNFEAFRRPASQHSSEQGNTSCLGWWERRPCQRPRNIGSTPRSVWNSQAKPKDC
jgi:hypothetical protein